MEQGGKVKQGIDIRTFDAALDTVVPGTQIPLEMSAGAGIILPVIAIAPKTLKRCFLHLGALFANAAFDTGTVFGARASQSEALGSGQTEARRKWRILSLTYQMCNP